VIPSALRRRLGASAAAALLGLGLSTVAAAPASAAGVGYVRLAHLSPDSPAVDVYLSSVSGTIQQQKFNAVGYGVVSKYLPLPPGTYAVAMRPVGAPATSPPILSTQVTVVEGQAYTVAGVGRYADLGLRVIPDDLATPMTGKAKVRVVQASIKQPVLNVVCAGQSIGDGVQFASTTNYQEVGPGKWTIKLTPPGSTDTTTVSAPLVAGGVYSLIVLDGKGGLTGQLRTDARSNGMPEGGVGTGAGGTANAGADGTLRPALLSTALVGLIALVAIAGGFRVRHRRMRTRAL
jgi:hypothetical protein